MIALRWGTAVVCGHARALLFTQKPQHTLLFPFITEGSFTGAVVWIPVQTVQITSCGHILKDVQWTRLKSSYILCHFVLHRRTQRCELHSMWELTSMSLSHFQLLRLFKLVIGIFLHYNLVSLQSTLACTCEGNWVQDRYMARKPITSNLLQSERPTTHTTDTCYAQIVPSQLH